VKIYIRGGIAAEKRCSLLLGSSFPQATQDARDSLWVVDRNAHCHAIGEGRCLGFGASSPQAIKKFGDCIGIVKRDVCGWVSRYENRCLAVCANFRKALE
jgi:hypothetical protein